MRTKSIFTGSCCAIITPFDKNGNPNFDALAKIIEQQIEGGTDAICACGTTGEASTMNDKEHLGVIEYIVKRLTAESPLLQEQALMIHATASHFARMLHHLA